MPHAARCILLRPDPRYDRDYGGQAPHASRGTLTPASRSARGFNMIEIAIAMAVVSIGIISMLGVMPLLLKSDRQAIEYTEASQLAQDLIESQQYTMYTPAVLDTTIIDTSAYTNTANGFYASNITLVAVGTNAQNTAISYTEPVAFASPGPLVKTICISLIWPRGPIQQTNTFITEIAATRNIRCQ